jgi:hypothetical protein
MYMHLYRFLAQFRSVPFIFYSFIQVIFFFFSESSHRKNIQSTRDFSTTKRRKPAPKDHSDSFFICGRRKPGGYKYGHYSFITVRGLVGRARGHLVWGGPQVMSEPEPPKELGPKNNAIHVNLNFGKVGIGCDLREPTDRGERH